MIPRLPIYLRPLVQAKKLISAEFKWYCINDAGQEVEYNNMLLENVTIVGVSPIMHDTKDVLKEKHNHLECVEVRYEKSLGNIVTETCFFQIAGMKG